MTDTDALTCNAKIRPFRPMNEIELACDLGESHSRHHGATLRDYAYPGSETRITWADTDRRNFRGLFVPCGDNDAPCILPWKHGGRHEES